GLGVACLAHGPHPASEVRRCARRRASCVRLRRRWETTMRYAIWNGGVAVDVEAIVAPRDAEDVALQVHRARAEGKHLKAVGAGHSFNDLALNEDVLIDLKHLNRLLAVDFESR